MSFNDWISAASQLIRSPDGGLQASTRNSLPTPYRGFPKGRPRARVRLRALEGEPLRRQNASAGYSESARGQRKSPSLGRGSREFLLD